jgi:uncharacterized membrane protein YqgA involved in biofilm formation
MVTTWGAVAATAWITLAAVTPAFAAALTGQITTELAKSTTDFGVALACFFGLTALGSPLSVWLVERLGAASQLGAAAALAGAAMGDPRGPHRRRQDARPGIALLDLG